jgi:hypothetical protein
MTKSIKRDRLLITIFAFLLLVGGTVLTIKIAKGYRPNISKMTLNGTGLLSATSYPKNAQVFINDHLTSVTDDTLYLSPDDYTIKIIKTGFYPWTKTIPIKPELVSSTDARLFPAIASSTPLTFYQVSKPLVSPDGNRLVYVLTNSPFNQDNGVYVLSLGNNMILGSQIVQIADMTVHDYTKAELVWSPDATQILAVFHDDKKITASHLLNSRNMNQAKTLPDTTIRLNLILTQWQEQLASVNKNNLTRLPELMEKVATASAVNVYFSPDREKLLYTVKENQTLPNNLIGKVIQGANPTTETRKLTAGKTYVYDLKEDHNYLVKEANFDPKISQPLVIDGSLPQTSILEQLNLLRGQTDPHSTGNLSWYSTSRHLVVSSGDGVSIVEYDDNNLAPIISAKINGNFAASSADGSHLLILSNLNQKPDVFNLISLDLK